MLLKRGDKKKKIRAAAQAVRARGGFEAVYTYTPEVLTSCLVFVVDDAEQAFGLFEDGSISYPDLEFEAYVLAGLPDEPGEEDFEKAEQEIDELMIDLADQLKAARLHLVGPIAYSRRKVPSDANRDPSFTSYKTAEFKIR